MDCSCDVPMDIGEYPDFYKEKEVTARKTHRCCECGREINPKEKYFKATGKWDGVISTYKTCLDCESIRAQFFGNGWIFGDVLRDLVDHISETDAGLSQECISKLTPAARDRVCDMIQRYWGRRGD